MSMSKRNTSLLIVVALLLVITLVAIMLTTTTYYAGVLPWSSASHFVAHCVGTTCGFG